MNLLVDGLCSGCPAWLAALPQPGVTGRRMLCLVTAALRETTAPSAPTNSPRSPVGKSQRSRAAALGAAAGTEI